VEPKVWILTFEDGHESFVVKPDRLDAIREAEERCGGMWVLRAVDVTWGR
jgi:hypothetical protein